MKFTITTQRTTTLTTRYLGHRFFVDITEDAKTRSAWIYTDMMGTKELMFGVLKENKTSEEFLGMVEREFEEYADCYEEDYL